MSSIELRPEDYQPRPPAKKDYRIGVIGCGGILNGAHLPAYQKFGYRVVACTDISEEAVRRTRERWGIPAGSTDIRCVLENPDVDVVDLAVHANQRLPVIEKIAAARKPVLSQKPFAMNWKDATTMVDLCEKAGVKLMINQQARWAPAHRAAKLLVSRGVIGHVYSVMHVNRSFQDRAGSWFVALENFNIIDHGIHYIDLSRYFTGRNPLRIKATTTRMPGQNAVSPMIFTILLEYEPSAQVMTTLHFNNIIQVPKLRSYDWYLDGTHGSIAVNQSELTVQFKDQPEYQVFQIQGTWFPDAFGGSMGEMMQALAENREPETSGRDNLNSVRIAYAAVESSETGKTVEF
ncbi:MAG: Gfo/Idh/MocA family oxidoreductase [Planctomycetes bacterium]|nr:Gfo/Idh/MocA family oxidoreductase [Planctomycetota bacterium]